MRTFLELFEQACQESCTKCIVKNKNNSAYTQAEEVYQEVFQKVQHKLENEEELLFELEEAQTAWSNAEQQLIYRQGFSDCFSLMKWISTFESL